MIRILGMLALGAVGYATAAVDVRMDLRPEASLAIERHALGGDLLAYVGTRTTLHMTDPNNETSEMLAYVGDRVWFDGRGEFLVATRSGKDLQPTALVHR